MNKPEPTMAWFDLETTGLEAYRDVPLELGIILTDDWGREVTSMKTLVYENNLTYARGMQRGHENEFVEPMHIKSGLWDDLKNYPTLSRTETEWLVVKFLEDWNVTPQSLPMCGNSIGSLDRPFTLAHFPKINEFLSYRNIDMSTIKELVQRLNPGLYQNLKPIIGDKSKAPHRVLGDCRAAIREYQCYIDEFLIVGDDDGLD